MTTSEQINSTEFPRDKSLTELEAKLAEGYIGGMTEFWQRQKDSLDGPNQEYPPVYVTNPSHGGKVTCHKCNSFILERDHEGYYPDGDRTKFPMYSFHKDCYNPYEHYYGIDKPLD